MQAMEISRTGLDVEWRRLELIAQNLASVDVAGTQGGTVYRAQHLVSGPKVQFANYLNSGNTLAQLKELAGVEASGVAVSSAPPRLVHEPGNPGANAAGFVSYPSIDHAQEMTLMIRTARAYEANIVAMGMAREMYSKALEIGRRS